MGNVEDRDEFCPPASGFFPQVDEKRRNRGEAGSRQNLVSEH